MKKCSVENCNKKHYGLGYCAPHWKRVYKGKSKDLSIPIRSIEKHGLTKSVEYDSWRGMINRCYNENIKEYKSYGARGILVCDRWKNSFNAFLSDMGNKPKECKHIDRIDNDKGYSPDNCRWADLKTSMRNRRCVKLNEQKVMEIRLSTDSVQILSAKFSVSESHIYNLRSKNVSRWKDVIIERSEG